ncbi:hypothetical protein FQZ97_1047820 [compost metagenome]
MRELQVLDDDARLDDAALPVKQHGELAQRPQLQPVRRVLRRVGPDATEFERRVVLVERDEDLLRVRRKGMAVERERHGETSMG